MQRRRREAALRVAGSVEVALGLALMEAEVEVAPVAAFDGSCATALTARSNVTALRIHWSSLLSWARACARVSFGLVTVLPTPSPLRCGISRYNQSRIMVLRGSASTNMSIHWG
jgi:hypothetical protein